MKKDEDQIHELLDDGVPLSERDALLGQIQSDPELLRKFNDLKSTIRMLEESERSFVDSLFTSEVMNRLPSGPTPVVTSFWRKILGPFHQAQTWRWKTAVSLAAIGLIISGGVFNLLIKNKGPDYTSAKEISVQINFYAPEAKSVSLAGNFNKWRGEQCPMQSQGNGLWTIRIPLKPGVYDYMFLIDGRTWLTDPQAPAHRDDGFGYKNSVLRVTSL